MNERDHGYSQWSPDALLTAAQQGFSLAPACVSHDADLVRAEAASVFELAAGEKVAAELAVRGITLAQIEKWTPKEVQHAVAALAPEAISEIRARIATLDDEAARSLQGKIASTFQENGLTQND